MVEVMNIDGQDLAVSDFGTVEGITAPYPRIAVAIALRAYPAGKWIGVHRVKYNRKTGHWTVNFGKKGKVK